MKYSTFSSPINGKIFDMLMMKDNPSQCKKEVNKMKIATIVSAALTIVLSMAAFAAPSLSGPTGGTNLPDATVSALNNGQIADDFMMGSNHNFMVLRGVYGIATNLEVGVAGYFDTDKNGADNNAIGVNAKYQLSGLNLKNTDKVAVGINYQDASGSFHDTSIYVVGTRQVTEMNESHPAVAASVGLNYNFAPNSTILRPYASVDATYSGGLNLNAELQFGGSNKDNQPMMALTARFPINNTWAAQVGYTNSNLGTYGTNSGGLIVGASCKFNTTPR